MRNNIIITLWKAKTVQYKLTENEAWTLTLMMLVYQPIIKNKTEAVHLNTLLGEIPEGERAHVRQGIQALADMDIFDIYDGAVHITNRSEGAFHFIGAMSNNSEAEIKDTLANNSTISSFIKDVNDEIRLNPPVMFTNVPKSKVQVTDDKTTMSIWAKIGYTIFIVWVLLGLFKLIATKL